MRLVMLKCQSCGASLEVDDDQRWVTCQYCGSRFLVENDVHQDPNPHKPSDNINPTQEMKAARTRILIFGGVLFGLASIAFGTHTRLRVFGLSVQEWCLFAYSAALIAHNRRYPNRTAKVMMAAFCVLSGIVIVAQIIAWMNNESFVLLSLP